MSPQERAWEAGYLAGLRAALDPDAPTPDNPYSPESDDA